MTKDELIENLAAIEHERWSDWQTYVHDRAQGLSVVSDDGLLTGRLIPQPLIERWELQIDTHYTDLTEREKQADREQVMRYWTDIVLFVESWIERDGGFDDAAVERAARWRRDMA
jgi:hypothetical protein